MGSSRWQVKRNHFGAALGLLFAVSIHFPHPRALFAYAVAGAITALRFRTLGWKWQKAFVPLGIAVFGLALGALVGPTSAAGIAIARVWRAAALFTQAGVILRAGLASAPIDPASPKQRLAQDFLVKRRQTRHAINDLRPAIDTHREAIATLSNLRAELAADLAKHGPANSETRSNLMQRVADQTAIVRASTERLKAKTLTLNAKRGELKHATQAWKDRDRAA